MSDPLTVSSSGAESESEGDSCAVCKDLVSSPVGVDVTAMSTFVGLVCGPAWRAGGLYDEAESDSDAEQGASSGSESGYESVSL